MIYKSQLPVILAVILVILAVVIFVAAAFWQKNKQKRLLTYCEADLPQDIRAQLNLCITLLDQAPYRFGRYKVRDIFEYLRAYWDQDQGFREIFRGEFEQKLLEVTRQARYFYRLSYEGAGKQELDQAMKPILAFIRECDVFLFGENDQDNS